MSSMKDLMADYREQVRQSLCNPVSHFDEDTDALLSDISASLYSYLAEVLEPISDALKYVKLTLN